MGQSKRLIATLHPRKKKEKKERELGRDSHPHLIHRRNKKHP
jgi:hypothetical protein